MIEPWAWVKVIGVAWWRDDESERVEAMGVEFLYDGGVIELVC